MAATSTSQYFYHGTSKRNARHILREGFRDWSWTNSSPLLKYKAERGVTRWLHDGLYGRGTYITRNWRDALYFGPVLFRIELQVGTRLVDLEPAPDQRILDTLTRKFGRSILTQSPLKVMPRNKRLTLDEAIQLARHHVHAGQAAGWNKPFEEERHDKLMHEIRSILIRYGIQGWGCDSDLNGIAIFATDRIRVHKVVVSLPTEAMRTPFRQCISEGIDQELAGLINAMQKADNRGAENTRTFFAEANQILKASRHGLEQ